MSQTLSIFGATGSIGTSAFALLDQLAGDYTIEVISGHGNFERLRELAIQYRPKLVVLSGQARPDLAGWPDDIPIAFGREALLEAAARPVDWALNAVIGSAGLPVSLKIAENAQTLALANKESLVAGGAILRQICAENNCTLLPVDSEHSAIFQCLMGQDRAGLERVILTASGGPFRQMSYEEMRDVSIEDALNHPVWKMGVRITIDSANMFNKALEMIEAKELFDLRPEQVDVIVHPQSIVHSFVEFSDQGQLAQLGLPDMQHAIAFALGYPKRLPLNAPKLDLAQIGALQFEAADEVRYPALRLAREAMQAGGVYAAALNAAKEAALTRFLNGEIGFLEIAEIVEAVLSIGDWNQNPQSLSDVEWADETARIMANKEKR